MVKRRGEVKMSPQFFKIILSPHAPKLHIPDEFVIKYGADLRDPVFLEVPTGAIWQVKLHNSNGTKWWLNEGWNQFKDYYSIGCGYFLLFQYNGNSRFSVFIFDLSASEIEYPSGPNEDTTFVDHASHTKNACHDGFLKNKTAKVVHHSYSKGQKSGIPFCLPERQDPNRVKLEKPDVEEGSNYGIEKDKGKEKLIKQNMVKNVCGTADKGKEHHNEVLDPSASKMTNTSKSNKRKYALNLEASHSRYPLRSKQVKLEQSKENGSPSYSGKQKPAAPLYCRSTQSERKECTRVKLEKANSKEDLCWAVTKPKREETNMEKLVKHNLYDEAYKFKGHCDEVPVVDCSTSKVTTTNQHGKKKTATNLDASNCRYPLRSKQLIEAKFDKGDVGEHCNEIPVVDSSATKMTSNNRHHEKKTIASLDTSQCRYPLRSKQLKEVKLETSISKEDLLYVAQKAKRKKANNVMLEKGDVEDHCKEVPVGDPSASATSRHNEKKTMTNLDASHCRYPLRSMQLKEVKLEQWEAVGNMHNKMPKNKAVAVSPYCKRQNSGLPASSPSCQPIRVKLEKPDNLFCATEKANRKETNNLKLDTGDMEGNFNSVAYKGKDSTVSEMTILDKKKMLPSEKHNWDIYFNPHFTVSMLPTYVSRNFQLVSCQVKRCCIRWLLVDVQSYGPEGSGVPFLIFLLKGEEDKIMKNPIKEKQFMNLQDIPVNFFKKYLQDEETIVNLRVSNGRTWRAKLFDIQSNCPKIESSGWRDFVHGNNLKEHDTCVFELIDGIEPVLDVTIFRAKTPAS